MSKYIIFQFLIICIILMGMACHECRLAEDKRFSEGQKAQNPFKGYETLKYSAGDSIIEFSGTGRRNSVHEYDISQSSCDWGLEEIDELKFQNENYVIGLSMSDRHDYNLFLFDNIKNNFFMSFFYIESEPKNNTGYDKFIDSLSVGGIMYTNLYKNHLFSTHDFPDSLTHAINLYYSTEYGIVKFEFSDGSTWELKEIVW